jgi:hypothetical protein
MKIANKHCRPYVEQRTPFQGSNLWGVWHKSTIVESTDKQYVVYSYGHHFPIYIFAGGQWFANKDKYSCTTSKHQGQARPYSVEMHWLNTDSMQRLAVIGYTEFVKYRLMGGGV